MSSSAGSGGCPAEQGWPTRALLLLIDGYRVALSPLLGGHCRFWPSCSLYAHEAIHAHGPWRGGGMAVRRLLRCHPFHRGGFDPVPDVPEPNPAVAPGETAGSPGE